MGGLGSHPAAHGCVPDMTLAGTAESSRRAAEWVRQNVPNAASSPPEITEGEVLYNFGK